MSTLQGLNFTNLNITGNFLSGIILSLLCVLIGNRINHLIKIFSLSMSSLLSIDSKTNRLFKYKYQTFKQSF